LNALNLCGGVSCNHAFYEELKFIADIYDLPIIRNPPELCTDNASMIAWMGWEIYNSQPNVYDLRNNINDKRVIPH
jgi:tRNA A37 threonylcarbamoyltransferase TsaD